MNQPGNEKNEARTDEDLDTDLDLDMDLELDDLELLATGALAPLTSFTVLSGPPAAGRGASEPPTGGRGAS